jgi:DNA-binding Lrp family transcriptional regulator
MALRGLDRIDGEILALLQANARMPNKEVAERVGIAPSTCLERVRRLVDEGVLVGFRGEVSARAMGVEVESLVSVRLNPRSRREVEAFRQFALKQQEVVAVFHIAGPGDFLLHVAARDSDHLRDFLMDKLGACKEVAETEGSILLRVDRASHVPDYASRRDPKNAELQREREMRELEAEIARNRSR